MNNTKISLLAAAKAKFVSLRKKWGIKNPRSIAEVAQKSGLPVEYLKNIPTSFEGFLDWHPEPRFIAVNPDLPAHDQAWFIARQIATWAQQQRFNSLALDRPWKWEMFDAAPAALKEKISKLDVEYRAHWLMLFWASGEEFRAFVKTNPKRFWSHTFTSNIVWYHLAKLRVKLWGISLRRKITVVAFPAL